jgi:hypothetical protein
MLSVVVLASGLAVGNGRPGTGAATAPVVPSFDVAWEGTLECGRGPTWDLEVREGRLRARTKTMMREGPCALVPDGAGAVRLRYSGELLPGIYKWDGRRLVLCFGKPGGPRPARFAATKGVMRWALEPVK